MSNIKALFTAEFIANFVEENLTKPAQDIELVRDALNQASEIAQSALLSVFSGNVHIGMSDIKKFSVANLNHPNPSNGILKKLHTKAWYAFGAILKEKLSPATYIHFDNNYLGKQGRLSDCPNMEGITKVLAELEEIEQAGSELLALKDQLNELAASSTESVEKIKLSGGSFEEKATLIAKLANLHGRLANITQPVHFAKNVVLSADEIYSKLLEMKELNDTSETEVLNKCRVKIFNNGNIDLKMHLGYTAAIFNFSL